MLIALLVASILSNGIGFAAFLRHLGQVAEREELRTAKLLDRIQAPAIAVARSSTDQLDPLPKPYVGFDNDDEAHEAAQRRSPSSES